MVANEDFAVRQEKRDRKIHVILMTGMIAVMLAGLGVVYISIQSGRHLADQQSALDTEGIGEVKELPDFMLEKIDKNDLESLKP